MNRRQRRNAEREARQKEARIKRANRQGVLTGEMVEDYFGEHPDHRTPQPELDQMVVEAQEKGILPRPKAPMARLDSAHAIGETEPSG